MKAKRKALKPKGAKGKATMTRNEKATTMFQLLRCSPATDSLPRFKRHADAGDAGELWIYFQECLRTHPEKDAEIEAKGLVSFRMLETAMAAINSLPTKG